MQLPQNAGPVAADRHAIVVALNQVQRAIAEHARVVSRDLGLTVTQLQALQAIGQLDPATPRGVAAELGRPQSTMTGVLDQLEVRGLVGRSRDAGDRRRILLRLTDRGAALLATAPGPVVDALSARLDALEPAEVAGLRRAMESLIGMMGHERDAG